MQWIKSLAKGIVSPKTTLFLLFIFAAAMARATFIENDAGTQAAREIVYESRWFELLMLWLALNFGFTVRKYRLLSRPKLPLGLFHIGFIVTILGSGLSRYFGFEGNLHIREGASNGIMMSDKYFLRIFEEKNSRPELRFETQKRFNKLTFSPSEYEAEGLSLKIERFIPNAEKIILPGSDTLFKITVSRGEGREDYLLASGETLALAEKTLGINSPEDTDIQLFSTDSGYCVRSRSPLQTADMARQLAGILPPDTTELLRMKVLYKTEKAIFTVSEIVKGKAGFRTSENKENKGPDVLEGRLSDGKNESPVRLFSGTGADSPAGRLKVGDKIYRLAYGAKPVELPFQIALKDFVLERYPGSRSPSAYSSEVEVLDGENRFPYKIFMNNVLDYRGYRFFQASYDTDEKGTVLSVNYDRPGTYLTYVGYFLITLGMILTLFIPSSRFGILFKKLGNIRAKRLAGLLIGAICLAGPADAQFVVVPQEKLIPISEQTAENFGRLIVQDLDGRMKPLNTEALELLRKLSGKSRLKSEEYDLDANRFLLSTQMQPVFWRDRPLMKIDPEKGAEILKKAGKTGQNLLAFTDLLDSAGNYILSEEVEKVYRKKPAERSEADNELMKTDERFNILFGLLNGDFLRIFPLKEDPAAAWFTAAAAETAGFTEEDARFVKNILPIVWQKIYEDSRNGKSSADSIFNYVAKYQQIAGEKVYPDEQRVRTEYWYNGINLLPKLFPYFWLTGLALLLTALLKIYRDSRLLRRSERLLIGLALLGFGAYTFHLLMRWYIADYPPWSNGFEMLIFVGWGLMLSGLGFSRKSDFTAPLALIFTGTLVFTAYLDWLNPEITNLVPVLKSYWLKIHVAVIVSAYAPLALSALLGLLSLLLLIFAPAGLRLKDAQDELVTVNEMSMTVGLFLLTIGTFLGGIWANESWGRYWAWDPKETWALISVIVYAIVSHVRLVPDAKSRFLFNSLSVWAFSSIIMTSFGVNYYLSGLHSYAKGDPVPVPSWVWIALAAVILINTAAFFRRKRLA